MKNYATIIILCGFASILRADANLLDIPTDEASTQPDGDAESVDIVPSTKLAMPDQPTDIPDTGMENPPMDGTDSVPANDGVVMPSTKLVMPAQPIDLPDAGMENPPMDGTDTVPANDGVVMPSTKLVMPAQPIDLPDAGTADILRDSALAGNGPANPPAMVPATKLVMPTAVDEPSTPNDQIPSVPLRSLNTPWNSPDFEFTLLAGGTGGYVPVNEHLVDTTGTAPSHYKFHLSGEGFSGGVGLGAMYRRGNNTLGAGVTGYLDTHTMKNYDHKNDLYGGATSNSMSFLSRSYTLEFAAKAGHYFGDWHAYGKLGVICSAFQYKYRNTGVDARQNLTAWGGVAGLGVQTSVSLPVLNEAKIGLEYDYQIYESLKPVVRYGTDIDTAQFRPRYHSGYLTISKPF